MFVRRVTLSDICQTNFTDIKIRSLKNKYNNIDTQEELAENYVSTKTCLWASINFNVQ